MRIRERCGEGDIRFFEAEIVRALKAVSDLFEFIFIQRAYVLLSIELGLRLDLAGVPGL